MSIITDQKRLDEIFNRGIVVQILPSKDELMAKLKSGQRLKIYIGADPTSNSLHLSHAKNYMFLEELRQLGHEVIILFGDFTAQIGDPTGRSDARKQLTIDEVKKNVTGWIFQIRPLMNFDDKENPPRIMYNNDWLSKLSFSEVIKLASNFTVQQMLERDMFKKRWNEDVPIHLHEFLYPIMQGYDSVAMDVDVELCGTDQIFNALVGRTLLKRIKGKEKFVVAVNLMENPKTGALMSKSLGTGVFLSSPPNEMYGAIMAQPDEMIEVLFTNCTRIPLSEKKAILSLGPRQAKARVALEIVTKFFGTEKANEAQEVFDETFQKKQAPENIDEIKINQSKSLSNELVKAAIVSSNSDWRRLVKEGAVRTDDGIILSDPNFKPNKTTILKIGKRRFVRILVK